MNWDKYFEEKDEMTRWDISWLMSLKYYFEKKHKLRVEN